MDAVISIGGQSLVDGLLRILSPALQALRSPLPVPLPAVSNAVLSIRSIQSVFPSARAGTLELQLEIDLTGEALVAASVVNQTLNITFPNPSSFTFPQLTGSVNLPTGVASLTLGPATGTSISIQLPAGVTTLPLPAVLIAFLIIAIPFIITGIVSGLLGTAVTQVFGGLQRLLQSPVALPPAIFEAFGELVPTTMMLDDLDARGVLRTPTSPWAVLPLLSRLDPRPPAGGEPGGPVPPPIGTTPVPSTTTPPITGETLSNKERRNE